MAKTVLVVDDDPTQRRLMQAAAEKQGFRARVVDNGELALAGNPDDERLQTNLKFYRAGIEAQLNGTA